MATLVFDLDGTLIDSAPVILTGFGAAIREHGLEPALPLEHRLIGPPLTQVMGVLLPQADEARRQAVADSFKRWYDHEGVALTGAYEGIHDMLDALKAQGHALHLATNKRLGPTVKIVDQLGWSGLFRSVWALDRAAVPCKNKAEMLGLMREQERLPEHCLYIGDTPGDREASQAQRMDFWGVSWGYGLTREESRLHHPSELPQALGAAQA